MLAVRAGRKRVTGRPEKCAGRLSPGWSAPTHRPALLVRLAASVPALAPTVLPMHASPSCATEPRTAKPAWPPRKVCRRVVARLVRPHTPSCPPCPTCRLGSCARPDCAPNACFTVLSPEPRTAKPAWPPRKVCRMVVVRLDRPHTPSCPPCLLCVCAQTSLAKLRLRCLKLYAFSLSPHNLKRR